VNATNEILSAEEVDLWMHQMRKSPAAVRIGTSHEALRSRERELTAENARLAEDLAEFEGDGETAVAKYRYWYERWLQVTEESDAWHSGVPSTPKEDAAARALLGEGNPE
jgi:hypothetical protein